MKRNTEYEINQIENKIIITKKFASDASVLNSTEYSILKQLRFDNPTFTVELREIKKKVGKKAYGKLTYDTMMDYIITVEGVSSLAFAEFEAVKKLSQIQAGPYAYVKKWFLTKYKDAFTNEAATMAEETNTSNVIAMNR